MGYDLHITRREFWFDEEGEAISLDEWQRYVESDPEIHGDPENPGPENYVIVSHPERWPLWWYRGEIMTKNPDEKAVAKLVKISASLRARVVGDDGEVYGLAPSNPTAYQQPHIEEKKPWWKIW